MGHYQEEVEFSDLEEMLVENPLLSAHWIFEKRDSYREKLPKPMAVVEILVRKKGSNQVLERKTFWLLPPKTTAFEKQQRGVEEAMIPAEALKAIEKYLRTHGLDMFEDDDWHSKKSVWGQLARASQFRDPSF